MYRALLLLSLTLLSTDVLLAEVLRLSEPVQKDAISETFGAPINQLPEIVTLKTLAQSPDSYFDKSFAVRTKVAKVCQKKGCFLIAHQGKESIRVAFKDYSFFVPTDIGGKEVTLVGQLLERDLSAKQAEHFSKDLGEEGSVEGGKVFEIVASSVRVPLR